MGKYEKGDVVLCYFPLKYKNNQNYQLKTRPALVLSVYYGGEDFISVQITTKNRTGKSPGKWIPKDSKIGKEMGLLHDSFINAGYSARIERRHIIRKIGFCSIVEEIVEIRNRHNLK